MIIQKYNQPRLGNMRIVRKFLWLPKTLKNQTHWLKWAKILEYATMDTHSQMPQWKELCFL